MLRLMSHPIEIMKLITGGNMFNLSLEETKVGTYIDSKPIYSKSFTGIYPNTSATWNILVDVEDLNIDELIFAFGTNIDYASSGSTQQSMMVSYNGTAGIKDKKYLIHYAKASYAAGCKYVITIYYTKTTD